MKSQRTRVMFLLAIVVTYSFVRSSLHNLNLPENSSWTSEDRYVDVWQKYGLEAIPVASRPHVVRPGEQLFHVAMQHRLPGPIQLTIDIIKELNNLWDRPLLEPGQKLRVPEANKEQWPIAVQKAWAGK